MNERAPPDPTTHNELSFHLAEYGRLSDEISADTQSIDRYLGLYLAAFFAVLAFMVQSGAGESAINYIELVKASPDLLFLALFVPVINGVLVVRIAHLTAQIFARAQHIGVRLRPRVVELLGSDDVLRWDGIPTQRRRCSWIFGFDAAVDDLPAKKIAQLLRVLPAAGFFALAIGFSVTILILLRSAWDAGPGLATLYVVSWAITAAAVSAAVLLMLAGAIRPPTHTDEAQDLHR